ncbi:hypothetical protein HFP71_33095 [Streptomyces sp. ARC32]
MLTTPCWNRAGVCDQLHLLLDEKGTALTMALTRGNRDDVTQPLPLLDRILAVSGPVAGLRPASGCSAGRPRP